MIGKHPAGFLILIVVGGIAAWFWSADKNREESPLPESPSSEPGSRQGGIENRTNATVGNPVRNRLSEFRDHLQKSSEGEPSDDWFRDFTAFWFADEGPACLETLRAEAPGPFRDRCLVMAIAAWASGAPEDALDWLTRLPERTLASRAANEAIKVWSLDEPRSAAAWIRSQELPAAELSDLKKTLIAAWMKTDSNGALEWIASETGTDSQEALRYQAAISARPEDRELLAHALLKTSSDKWRDQSLEVLLRSWAVHDPTAAEAWMHSQGADEHFRSRVKEVVTHPGNFE